VTGDARLHAAARRVADGCAADDLELAAAGPAADGLRIVAKLAESSRRGTPAGVPAAWLDRRPVAWFTIAIAAVCVAKIASGLALGILMPSALPAARPGLPATVFARYVTAGQLLFAAIGLLLMQGARRDRRASDLGCFFLLIASSLTTGNASASSLSRPLGIAARLTTVQPESFLPLAWWAFIREFPRCPSGRGDRIVRFAIAWSAVLGVVLFLANLAFVASPAPASGPWGRALAAVHRAPRNLFWPLLLLTTLPGLPLAVWRAAAASIEERARVRLFLLGIAFGFGPLILEVLLEAASPTYRAWSQRPSIIPRLGLVIYPLLLSMPATTAYAVAFDRVLDVRLALRRTAQYAVARYTLLAAMLLPAAALAAIIYQRREEPISHLLSGGTPAMLASTAAAAVVAWRLRPRILGWIDVVFAQVSADVANVVSELARRLKYVSTPIELAETTLQEIALAIPTSHAELLVLDPRRGTLEPFGSPAPALSLDSAIVAMLEADLVPLRLTAHFFAVFGAQLPAADQTWLSAVDAELLVPLAQPDERLCGIIVLGRKRSDAEFSAADVRTMAAIAGAASLALHSLLARQRAWSRSEAEVGGAECTYCRRIQAAYRRTCVECGGRTHMSFLPPDLHGRFAVERRIGTGGMGVVYKAMDLTLNRAVAIKTLPPMSAVEAHPLIEEARAMAAVSHPHLASIFGAELYSKVPLLVVEYLPGGTLADRLRTGPLPPVDTIDLGIALCDALGAIHAAGLLHRDVKPSNIGFTATGVPKLLDFGLARTLRETTERDAGAPLAGSPPYLAPESIRGCHPGAHGDLWALAVVLYESLTGSQPFAGDSVDATLARVLSVAVPPPSHVRPGVDRRWDAFFARVLHPDGAARFASLHDFRSALAALAAR
jgi:GAF domain-containing protein